MRQINKIRYRKALKIVEHWKEISDNILPIPNINIDLRHDVDFDDRDIDIFWQSSPYLREQYKAWQHEISRFNDPTFELADLLLEED